ncbi:MAG: hypothetical protein LBH47_03490 [Christensenellaceae bacterium]|jgi:hypothetical protein|nr:hypothetical protein [Christensenellaceae bacterium]
MINQNIIKQKVKKIVAIFTLASFLYIPILGEVAGTAGAERHNIEKVNDHNEKMETYEQMIIGLRRNGASPETIAFVTSKMLDLALKAPTKAERMLNRIVGCLLGGLVGVALSLAILKLFDREVSKLAYVAGPRFVKKLGLLSVEVDEVNKNDLR